MYIEDCIYCDEEEPEMCPLHGEDNEDDEEELIVVKGVVILTHKGPCDYPYVTDDKCFCGM